MTFAKNVPVAFDVVSASLVHDNTAAQIARFRKILGEVVVEFRRK